MNSQFYDQVFPSNVSCMYLKLVLTPKSGPPASMLTQPTPCHSEPKTLPNYQVTPVTKLLRLPMPPTHPRGRPSIHRNPGLRLSGRIKKEVLGLGD